MKKTIIFSTFLALCLISCSKQNSSTPQIVSDEDMKTVYFTSDNLSKTTISAEGKVSWEEGDEISVYYVNTSNVAVEKKAVAKVYAGGGAVFEASIPVQDTPDHYYASYPSGTGTLLPAKGTAAEEFSLNFGSSNGSFKKANYMAAYCTGESMKFSFKNAGAVVRVQIGDEGYISRGENRMKIKSVSVQSQRGSYSLSATILPVIVSDDAVTGFGTPTGTVTEVAKAENIPASVLSSSFVYVPVLPCNLENGYMVIFEVEGGANVPAMLSENKNVGLERSSMFYVLNATDRIAWDYYVSPEGTGDGKSETAPMSFSSMSEIFAAANEFPALRQAINGVTFNLEGGKTFDASKGVVFNVAYAGVTFSVAGGWKSAEKAVLDGALTQKFINFAADSHASFRDIVFYKGQDHDAGNGGALYAGKGTLEFRNCDFVSNSGGTKPGGAFYITSSANVMARDCNFINNSCSGNSGGAISLSSSAAGNYYFTNCIFTGNDSGNYYGCAIHASKGPGFLGINNCLFYDNHGTKKGTTDGGANLNISATHCLINSTFISPVTTYANVFGLRCGAMDSFGGSLLANNIILNENAASGSYVPYAMSTVNTSYWIRSVGYNQYDSYNDNDHILLSLSDNMIGCPLKGNKPGLFSYTWDEDNLKWEWDASSKVGDMPDFETLLSLIENDKIDGQKTSVGSNATAFVDWLMGQSYNNGADNALTVDVYGTPRDTDSMWPGCYQKGM